MIGIEASRGGAEWWKAGLGVSGNLEFVPGKGGVQTAPRSM